MQNLGLHSENTTASTLVSFMYVFLTICDGGRHRFVCAQHNSPHLVAIIWNTTVVHDAEFRAPFRKHNCLDID